MAHLSSLLHKHVDRPKGHAHTLCMPSHSVFQGHEGIFQIKALGTWPVKDCDAFITNLDGNPL